MSHEYLVNMPMSKLVRIKQSSDKLAARLNKNGV